MLELSVSTSWAIGLALAVTRAAAFVAMCSFVPRSIPSMGRSAFAIALGLLVCEPISAPDASAAHLAVLAAVNVLIGGILGWFLGLASHLFQVAGTVVDTASGITLGAVFDPDSGTTPGPLARFFTLGAQTLIIALGGLSVMAQVLWLSTRAIPLDGSLGELSPLGAEASDRLSALFQRGVELALPIAAVLFVGELAFGMLSRMAPQINTFLMGLPLKTLIVLSMLGSACVLFPRFADQAIASGVDSVTRLLGGG